MCLFFQLHSESVTHIISENNSGDEVRTWLGERGQLPSRPPVHLLDISWYTESMRESLPVTILDRHRLQVKLCQDTNQSMVPIRLGLVLWYSFVPGCIVKKNYTHCGLICNCGWLLILPLHAYAGDAIAFYISFQDFNQYMLYYNIKYIQ